MASGTRKLSSTLSLRKTHTTNTADRARSPTAGHHFVRLRRTGSGAAAGGPAGSAECGSCMAAL
jgi:hypothetical protein